MHHNTEDEEITDFKNPIKIVRKFINIFVVEFDINN
jgi:hypothetical protein